MIFVTNGTVSRALCTEADWMELAEASIECATLRELVETGVANSSHALREITIPDDHLFLRTVKQFAKSLREDEPVVITSKSSKLDSVSSLERASKREMLRESLLLEEKVRAPVGYTRVNPLVVAGRSYVGGQFIPGATKADVQKAVERQATKDDQSQSAATMRNRRLRAETRANALVPASQSMFPSSTFMPVDTVIAGRYQDVTNMRDGARDAVLRTANLTQSDFMAGRPDLQRSLLMDNIRNGSQGQPPAFVIRNLDKSYTVVTGHQRIIASLMTGEPTIPAKIISRADVESRLRALDEQRAPRPAAPIAPAPTVVQATERPFTASSPTAETIPPPPGSTPPATMQAATRGTHGTGTFGHSPTAVCAWMGANGWSSADARRVMQARGVTIPASNYSSLVSHGRTGRTQSAPLTSEHIAELNAMRAGSLVAPQSSSGTVGPATRPNDSQLRTQEAAAASARVARPEQLPPAMPVAMSAAQRAEIRARETPQDGIKRLRSEYKAYLSNGAYTTTEWRDDWAAAKQRVLQLPESQFDQPQARNVPRSRRTPAEQLEATQGAERARQRVAEIKAKDISGMRPLQRPDRNAWTRVTVDRRANQFMKQHGAACTGAPPGSKITVGATARFDSTHDRTVVDVEGPHGLNMQRHVYTPRAGADPSVKGYVYNAHFFTNDGAPDGLGTGAFTSQVAELQAHGFGKIKVGAAGSGNHVDGGDPGSMNGYYTWPRFGYMGRVPDDISEGKYGLPFAMRDVTKIEELMTTKEGRDFWRKHGRGGSYEFDLDKNSYSNKHLVSYFNDSRGG